MKSVQPTHRARPSHHLNSPELLMQTADKAMYGAKAGGRDQVKVA